MFTLEDILQGTQGHLDQAVVQGATSHTGFSRVVTDSRGSLNGALFVALKGEHMDGHSFVLDAMGHGASGAIVQHDWQPPDALPPGVALIRVDDPLQALQRLAAYHRARYSVQVIGITGSIGKTSTKEVVASVLSTRFQTLKSVGNLNNEIGLPLTLLNLTPEHKKAVLEMGAGYALGELTLLCEIAQPEIAVVTNVGPVHLERMGTVERIALNKSELVRSLPQMGTAVLNGDDPLVLAMREVTQGRVITYGLNSSCDMWADEIESRGLNGVRFTLHVGHSDEHYRVQLPLLGRHSVYTALAAAGAAHAAGMTWDEIISALESLGGQVRLLIVPGYNGSTLIDDSYNAAPASTIAALDLLAETPGSHIAVLGDMLELGSHELEGHCKVGCRAAEVAGRLIVVGKLGRLIGEEALRQGMAPDRVLFAADNAQVVEYLRPLLQPEDFVLIKGSRGLYMDEIVNALKS